MPIVKISDFLTRVKNPIDIKDDKRYKRITIKINHLGVFLRDIQEGHLIGTKKQFIVSKGQFILSKIDAMNGAFGIVSDDLDNAIITGNFWTFDFDENKVDLEWFNLFTSSDEFVEICRKASSGTTHRKYLDEKKFNNYELDLPDKGKQKEITKKIKSISKYQEETKSEIQRQYQTNQLLRQSILQDAIQGKLIPQDQNDEPAEKLLEKIKIEKEKLIKEGKIKKDKSIPAIKSEEIPFELPKGWVWTKIDNVCSYIQRGKSPEYSEVEKIPVISQKCVQWRGFDIKLAKFIKPETFEKYDDIRKLCDLDLLWNSTGDGTVGRVALYEEAKNNFGIAVADSHVSVLRPKINNYFLYFICSSPYIQNKISSIVTGSTKQTELGLNTIKNLVIPVPPLNEQIKIVEKVNSLIKICDEQEKNISETKENINKLNQAILREMFN